jgi:rhamnose utilization protein RhaD (predicted bifunctional aldolase and dehydrogenase)/NAD(P)-dependent dehydrogenase (short-subunit alcohol dehydrogenase family)
MIDELRQHDDLTDEQMVDLVARTSLLPGAPRPSIETLLHGFMPFTHIDHVHADAICALTNHAKGREATQEALGDEWAYVEWLRSGFPLSKVVEKLGDYRGVVLAHHGVITWAETSEDCLKETHNVVRTVTEYLADRAKPAKPISLPAPAKESVIPRVRAGMSQESHVVVRLDERFLEIANRVDVEQVVKAGVSSADHMLRIRPFSMVAADPSTEGIDAAFQAYRATYDAYTERNKALLPEGFDLFQGVPKVVLVPGLGALTAGKSVAEAEMVAEIALHTHQVAATALDCFGEGEPMPDSEIFRFEYWPMELYKLGLKPAPRQFAGRVFAVTGAASGIGRQVALRLGELGASLVLADLNSEGLDGVVAELAEVHGVDAIAIVGDQTDATVIHRTVTESIAAFGGIDGVVLNAGIAVAGRLTELSSSDWEKALEVNLTSAFLLTQATMRLMIAQGMGGSLVFMASKNAFAPGEGFGAYSVTKAGLIQMMRIAAIEGGSQGIRSNALNPDAVFDNSQLWAKGIREERAAAHGIKPEELEDFYAKRNILHRHVRSSDVAAAAEFLLSDASSRTTGAVIPVDGGVVGGFPR